jgi:hypothetical protein
VSSVINTQGKSNRNNELQGSRNMQVKQRIQGPNHGSPRIPLALQAVFLDGNRGMVVDAPPADKSAMKTFFRWRWWGRSVSNYTGNVKKKETQPIEIKAPIEPKRPRKKKVSDDYWQAREYNRNFSFLSGYFCATLILACGSAYFVTATILRCDDTITRVFSCYVFHFERRIS